MPRSLIHSFIHLFICCTTNAIQETGISAPNGFVPNNVQFENNYYKILVGSMAKEDATAQQIVDSSPLWERFFLDNTGLVENDSGTNVPIPSQFYWTLQLPDIRLGMVRFWIR
jgi:hypothetical protein